MGVRLPTLGDAQPASLRHHGLARSVANASSARESRRVGSAEKASPALKRGVIRAFRSVLFRPVHQTSAIDPKFSAGWEANIDFRRVGRLVARIDDLPDQANALNVRHWPILQNRT